MVSSDLHPVLFKCIPHAGNCQVCNINIYFSHLYMIIIVFLWWFFLLVCHKIDKVTDLWEILTLELF